MSKRRKIATGRVEWALAKMGHSLAITPDSLKAIALHLKVPLVGKTEAKRLHCVAGAIRRLMPGCPGNKSLRGSAVTPKAAERKPNVISFDDPRIDAFYKSWEWKRVRYEFLKDCNRRCECCGASAPTVAINVDHIKPIRKFWNLRLDPTNLQALCSDCNMGKGSTDMTDWRKAPTSAELIRLDAIKNQLSPRG